MIAQQAQSYLWGIRNSSRICIVFPLAAIACFNYCHVCHINLGV